MMKLRHNWSKVFLVFMGFLSLSSGLSLGLNAWAQGPIPAPSESTAEPTSKARPTTRSTSPVSAPTFAAPARMQVPDNAESDEALVSQFMKELRGANKTRKWSETIYPDQGWHVHGTSVKGRPLIYYVCGENNENTTLMLSSVHGDEITPVYFGLRLVSWLKGEPDLCRDYRVVVAPLINPDGYLGAKLTRGNSHGVDLNRNFPTKDFEETALKIWKSQFKSDPRRYPGPKGGSEPETAFQQWLIDEFRPKKILTVHSPLNFFDYDGPENDELRTFTAEYIKSCEKLRAAVRKESSDYNFLRFGYFPGSLGNYAGKERGIPTLTLELPTVDASKAKSYFERLKKGTRELVVYKVKGSAQQIEAYSKSGSSPK